MQNYDQWKLDNPYDNEDSIKECCVCDAPIQEDETYCSFTCKKADDI